MPRTESKLVYQFDELSDRAKEKARDWWRQGQLSDDFWHECVIDDAKSCLKLAGFDIDRIYFSGFSSQGDGACFEGTWRASDAQPVKAMKAHAPKDKTLHAIAATLRNLARRYRRATMQIKHRGHYYHEFCTDIDVELNAREYEDDKARSNAEWDALAAKHQPSSAALREAAQDAMRWVYRQLEREYEYQNSDEIVDETIRANEYEFNEDGSRA